MPPHRLRLKEGMPIMLLRNIDKSAGLANGTILTIRKCMPNTILAEIMGGEHSGVQVFLPTMKLQVSEKAGKKYIPLARRQFPARPAFAMTINKSQGQTLQYMGLYLPQPVFGHGQFYVSHSRVGARAACRVMIVRGRREGMPGAYTRNVVYKEALLP